MRVMFWSALYWPHIGGVQEMANRLLPALMERGHRFLVVAERNPLDLPTEDEHHGIPIYRFPFSRTLRDIDRLSETRKKVIHLKQAFGPDLCHVDVLSTTDFYCRICAHVHPTPLLVSLCGEWPQRLEPLLRTALLSADWVVCDSAHTLTYAHRVAPATAHISSVIRNALPPPDLTPTPLAFDPPCLLYLGRLSREKGVDRAVTAFRSVAQRCPDARFLIAGDGPERDALKRQTTALGLSEAVRFLGWVPPENVPQLLDSASILILPSRADSFPLVGLQAALMERPVVAFDVGGVPEMIVDRETGLLVDAANADKLAEAVSYLLEHPDDAMRMGKAARGRALQMFSFDRHVKAYDSLYRQLVSDWRARHRGESALGAERGF
jgi:glycogen(starch) synthase